MLAIKLSGDWLWPPQDEIDALVRANARDNPVEAVMRIRALVEISRDLDTSELAALANRRRGNRPPPDDCLSGERTLAADE